MKKILLSISFILILAAFANAQSFKIYYKGTTNEITDTIRIDSLLNSADLYQKVKCENVTLKNISGAVVKTRCVRTVISEVVGSENNFCFGSGCYGTSVNTSPLLQSPDIAAGAIDNSFVGDYTPTDNEGSTIITYCFYDNANPSDDVCFTVKYTATYTMGIHDLAKAKGSISNAYPNPAGSNVFVKYQMSDDSQNGKIILHDMLGKVVKEIALNDKQGTSKIDVSDINEGVYFYTYLIDNKAVSTKKLIVSSK